ncbi:N-acetylmuramoyl-L-alanine amidase CwlD [Bacillus massiliglaciei]|uniref:N-acetylmuramoyl-L-alanine amidase CwlD n=1 Tax=Bacillus massiliglaciei TaxID=1816693 RepID=UPI000B1B5A61|nr:N-acetylmuramoyl-L-alanine amidase CwlD [Bacillus massiliglaciei]
MRKRLTYTGFAIGGVLLFLVFTFQFSENDSWKSWNLPLSGKIIVIDPGHGGMDGGANVQDIMEKDISLAVSLKIRDYLQEQGALVILTRETDRDLADGDEGSVRQRKQEDLRKRAEIINDSEADLFLSIHLNAFPSSSSKGAQTFYTKRFEENEQLSKFIQAEIIRNLENTSREAKQIQNIYLMEHAKKPGALVEIGFLSNAAERERLKSEKYQDSIAASVYKGVLRYLTEEKVEKDDQDDGTLGR